MTENHQEELTQIEAWEAFIKYQRNRVEAYEEMLENASEIYAKFKDLQKVFDAFVEAFPEDTAFKEGAEKNRATVDRLAETIEYGSEVAEKHKYHLDEEKGYLAYRKKQLLEGEEDLVEENISENTQGEDEVK